MKKYDTADLRNVGLVGHQSCGKTSIAEAILFAAKSTPRLGSVDAGTGTFDTEPEEVKRKGSLGSHTGAAEWKKKKVTVIDTPGDSNFFSDTRNCMSVMDGVVVIVSAVDGVQVQTDRGFSIAGELALPRALFFSKLDRERADFDTTLADAKKALSEKIVALQLPIGKEDQFAGVVDLVGMKAYRYKTDGSGEYAAEAIPGDLAEVAKKAHEALVDAVAASDDALTEKYLEKGDLDPQELVAGLQKAFRFGTVIPVFCGSGTRAIGIAQLLDFVAESFPSPLECPPQKGKNGKGEEVERKPEPAAPFSAQVFKTIVDQFTGKVSLFRVWSGSIAGDSTAFNATRDTRERFGPLLVLQGKKSETVAEAGPGDIVAVAKLKETMTGDTLCDEKNVVQFDPLPAANPVISFALKAKTKSDEDKLATALARIIEEDPTIQMSRDTEAKETLISGMGQVHIEVTVEKMRRKFGVDVELLPPKVPYRETIKGRAMNVEGKHKKQSGGRGQFGVCYINIEPLQRGSGYVFDDQIVGGAIPRQWIPSVDKGIRGALQKGPIAGFPVVDIKVTLFDGKYHDVDSSDFSFQMAGSKGFKAGFKLAKPCLLEPIMTMEVTCPDENMGDVIGDINQRRGRVLNVDSKGRNQIIKAKVPMSELLRYAPDLRSITGGRGSFSMEFSHYDELPGHLAEKVIAERGKPAEEQEEE